jgi:hypothetical protein
VWLCGGWVRFSRSRLLSPRQTSPKMVKTQLTTLLLCFVAVLILLYYLDGDLLSCGYQTDEPTSLEWPNWFTKPTQHTKSTTATQLNGYNDNCSSLDCML